MGYGKNCKWEQLAISNEQLGSVKGLRAQGKGNGFGLRGAWLTAHGLRNHATTSYLLFASRIPNPARRMAHALRNPILTAFLDP